jgi:hypothetical protein
MSKPAFNLTTRHLLRAKNVQRGSYKVCNDCCDDPTYSNIIAVNAGQVTDLRWANNTGGTITTMAVSSGVDSFVFVGGRHGVGEDNLYMYNGDTGNLIDSIQIDTSHDNPEDNYPVDMLVEGNNLYVASSNSIVMSSTTSDPTLFKYTFDGVGLTQSWSKFITFTVPVRPNPQSSFEVTYTSRIRIVRYIVLDGTELICGVDGTMFADGFAQRDNSAPIIIINASDGAVVNQNDENLPIYGTAGLRAPGPTIYLEDNGNYLFGPKLDENLGSYLYPSREVFIGEDGIEDVSIRMLWGSDASYILKKSDVDGGTPKYYTINRQIDPRNGAIEFTLSGNRIIDTDGFNVWGGKFKFDVVSRKTFLFLIEYKSNGNFVRESKIEDVTRPSISSLARDLEHYTDNDVPIWAIHGEFITT